MNRAMLFLTALIMAWFLILIILMLWPDKPIAAPEFFITAEAGP